MHSKVDVVIVGAGPAGLSAASQLVDEGHKVTVLEQDLEYVGGLARTVKYGDVRFDLGGHRFFTKNSQIQQWWERRLPADFLKVKRLSRIYYRGRFFVYPLRPWNALKNLGPFASALCIISYFRRVVFPLRPERSFEDWVSNRFGDRLFRIFFKTYTEKVWGVPCTEISADWASQRIKDLSLSRAVANAFGFSGSLLVKTLIDEFHYPRFGPGMMWEKTRDDLVKGGCTIQMGERVVSVHQKDCRVIAVETSSSVGARRVYTAEQFMFSMPLRDTILLMNPRFDQGIEAAARRLKYRDFITVALIIESRELFPDNWIYIHDPNVRVGRIQNFNNWSRDMVPDAETTCLGLEYFCSEGDSLWELTDEAIIKLAKRELIQLNLVGPHAIRGAHVVRVEKAYPIYAPDYKDTLCILRNALSSIVNLQVIGRNGMHKYNNQDHSMLTGFLAASNLGGERKFDLWRVNTDAQYLEEEKEVP
jgi:protoporphyrinogen oxidase